MAISSWLRDLLCTFDLFSTSQFLRYRKDDAYQTVSGGLTSLLVIAIFCILFANTALDTINRSIINWTSKTENYFEPTNTKLSFAYEDKFMITVGIMGLDITDASKRYFDIQLVETHMGAGGVVLGTNTIDLQPCTLEHFSITEQLKANFQSINALKRLCPPMNYSYNIYGKFTSKEMKYLQVRVSKCNSSLEPSRPCVSDSLIDNLQMRLGQFTVGLFYVNPLINPASEDYLDYYFEDRNFLTFTTKMGAYSMAHVQDFTIQTDESLLPLTQTKVDKGIIIPELFQIIPYEVAAENYASFYFMKSSSQTTYQRSFNKVDELFSYVGGLIGTILGVMIFMGRFTMMSFELDVAQRLFVDQNKEHYNFKNFNIFTYVLFLIYKLGKTCGGFKDWHEMKVRLKCQEEVNKQLDICLFLQRFSFLERAVSSILGSPTRNSDFYQIEQLQQLKARRKKLTQQRMKNYDDADEKSSSSESEGSSEYSQQQNNLTPLQKIENLSISQDYLDQVQPSLNVQSPRKRPRKVVAAESENERVLSDVGERRERGKLGLHNPRTISRETEKVNVLPRGELKDHKSQDQDINLNQTLFFQQLEIPKND